MLMSVSYTAQDDTSMDNKTPVIVGAVVGSVGGLLLVGIVIAVIAVAVLLSSRRKQQFQVQRKETNWITRFKS